MAKASVTVICSECGTEFTITRTCHNRRSADDYEKWVEEQDVHLCSDCRRKAYIEAERKRAEEAAKGAAYTLPELTGSEKQIAWATTIRNSFVGNCPRENLNGRIVAQDLLSTHAKASWWIDNRFVCQDSRPDGLFSQHIIDWAKSVGFALEYSEAKYLGRTIKVVSNKKAAAEAFIAAHK